MSVSTASPLTPSELVDEYFIENRNRVLEVAAFLDRLDRAGAEADFRMRALHEALAVLADAAPHRVHRVQMLLSDPTTEPRPALDRKGAVGAWHRPASGERS
jgi:hypothetical protein